MDGIVTQMGHSEGVDAYGLLIQQEHTLLR
jgi:hypothetical protein